MSVTVQASKHPLKPEWVYADVDAGQSIYEIAGGAPVAAYINGREVPEEFHRLTQPKDGATLVLWPLPQDDELKRTIGQIAITIGTIGVTSVFGPLAGAAFNLAATSLLNELVPLPTPTTPDTPESFNRLESITGTSNEVAAFKPIPRLYGTFRMFPPLPMTARPYTEIQGDDQYLRMFLCLGYGPLEIGGQTVGSGYSKITEQDNLSGTPIKIGETNIELFDEVEYEIGAPDQMTLYSDQIIENDPAFSTGENDDGDFAIRTTETDVDEISIGLAGRLFGVNDKAKTRRGTVRWRIEYREVGQSSFIVENDDFVVNSSKKETVRVGYRFRVPRGQYEVKLTRKSTSFAADTSTAADFSWNALRSIRSVQPFDVDGTVCMALRIKSTDQLNGRIDDLSVLATSVLDVYNGSSWVKQATNNPAWAYADIWTGTPNRRPLDKNDLDADALLDWANYCDQEGFEYNGVFDSSGTTFERATEVASTGLANWQFTPDAKVGVVRDVVQSVPKMIISPRNSFGFNYELAAVEVPDALRVRFVDTTTWENTERLVFDDGFDESNAEKYETLEAKGVTSPEQAWKFGRYHIAQQRLRPERYSFKQDVQHLRYQRGDMLTIQYDTILVGLAAGRIKEVVSDTEIVVDEQFVDNGESYGVKIQHQDGSVSTTTCTLGSGLLNNRVFLDNAVTITNPDDLVIFGEAGKESIDVKVTAIEPEGDFVAKITTVPAADEIEQAWDGDIPAFDPVLTEPVLPDRTQPIRPVIESVRSGEQALYVDDDGSLRVRMLVETTVPQFPGWDQKTRLRYRPVGDSTWDKTEYQSSGVFSIFNVTENVFYEVQAQSSKSGKVSPWTPSFDHQIVGKTSPPNNVRGFSVKSALDRLEFEWIGNTDPDLDYYEIREGSVWEDSDLVTRVSATKFQTSEVTNGPWMIKAVDTSGNYSDSESTASLSIALPETRSLTGQVIDNNVLLRWGRDVGTFLIDFYEVRKGDTLSSSELVGTSDKTFDVIFEVESGTYTYWIVPVDAAGNKGSEDEITLSVDEPPDFLFRNKFNASTNWQNVNLLSNIEPNADNISAVLPFDKSDTPNQRISDNQDSPQDAIDLGFNYLGLPTPSDAAFEEEYDLGVVVESTRVNVDITRQSLSGSISPVVQISVKEQDSDPWTDFPVGQDQVFATNFRYIKTRVDFPNTDPTDFSLIRDIETRLSVKIKNDSGNVNVTSNPTNVQFGTDFIDVASITTTPQGTSPLVAVVDFLDAPNPTDFDIYLFDQQGNPATGTVRWSARGF